MDEICRQIKDPTRDGGRRLKSLQEHIAKDDLVTWLGSRCGTDAGTWNSGAAWNSNLGLDRDRRSMSVRA